MVGLPQDEQLYKRAYHASRFKQAPSASEEEPIITAFEPRRTIGWSRRHIYAEGRREAL